MLICWKFSQKSTQSKIVWSDYAIKIATWQLPSKSCANWQFYEIKFHHELLNPCIHTLCSTLLCWCISVDVHEDFEIVKKLDRLTNLNACIYIHTKDEAAVRHKMTKREKFNGFFSHLKKWMKKFVQHVTLHQVNWEL